MRPGPGGHENPPSQAIQDGTRTITSVHIHVLLPRIPTYPMGPLHSSTPWAPASLSAQRMIFSLPFVQIGVPHQSPVLWQPSRRVWARTASSVEPRQLNRFQGLDQAQESEAPWFESNDTASSQRILESSAIGSSETSTGTESRNMLITNESSSASYYLASESTRVTSVNSTINNDSTVSTSDTDLVTDGHPFLKSDDLAVPDKAINCNSENISEPFCEADTEEDFSLSLASLRALSVPTMQQPNALAKHIANRVIRHARYNKIADEREMWCLDCGLIPVLPVTGQCGHTRCTKCIKSKGACPCGAPEPKCLHINTLIQDLITKMLDYCRPCRVPTGSSTVTAKQGPIASTSTSLPDRGAWPAKRYRRFARSYSIYPTADASSFCGSIARFALMSMQTRYEMSRKLVTLGRHLEAASHLAHVAASTDPLAKPAHVLLAQTIMVLIKRKDCRRVTRELYRAVRQHSASGWLQVSDLECILCCTTFTEPVTTPCGHTYCRTCIEKALDYRKTCALCLRSLDNFNLAVTRDTNFVRAALASIDALYTPPPPDPDVIPIFVCTVAYPAIPCPLFIFDPRYWLMVRRVLESGSRQFGMVAYERDRSYSNYGTILKVCDCVHLEDGRSILSTVGLSRFRVIERDVRDGCDVARVQPVTDIMPTDSLILWELRITASQICCKALLWLNSMDKSVYSEIEAAFGRMPQLEYLEGNWWEGPDGPAWLWWLIAILPLRSEIKVLILSTQSLLKRMTAVSRTLEAIDQIAITTTAELELRRALNTADEWL